MNNQEKTDFKKFDLVQFVLITISVVTLTYSIYYLVDYYMDNNLLLSTPSSNFKNNKLSPNEMGDSIGGILNPIIGISGSLLTFLAFYIQYKTNKTQVILFDENQKEQNRIHEKELFFRLVDNLNNKIFNTKINIDETLVEGFTAIDSLNKLTFRSMNNALKSFGRSLLQIHPDLIWDKFYDEIAASDLDMMFKKHVDAQIFKEELISMPQNERGEYLKGILGYSDQESSDIAKALSSIGGVHFYKVPFDDLKEDFYSRVCSKIYHAYSTIIDGYMRSFNAILNFVENSTDKNYFYQYLQNSLSNQELCLIFYYCSSSESSDYFRKQIRNSQLLNGYLNRYRFFIDAPSHEELETEINHVLNIKEVII